MSTYPNTWIPHAAVACDNDICLIDLWPAWIADAPWMGTKFSSRMPCWELAITVYALNEDGQRTGDSQQSRASRVLSEHHLTIMFPTDQPQTVASVECEAEATCMITSTGRGDLRDSYD